MPDGSLVEASKEKHGDAETQALFYGVPLSEGTLGIIVAVTLRIIPVKPFVKITYTPTSTVEEMKSKLTEESNCRENEFVEGLQLSRNAGVVLRGRFSEGPPKNFASSITRIGRWYWPWFYTHVEAIVSSKKDLTEFIPIRDYYYRHTRSLYWELRDLAPFANSFLFRWFYGWMSAPKKGILKVLTPSPLNTESQCAQIHEDILVPMEYLQKIVELCDREAEIYPLWLCPYNQPSCTGMIRQRTGRNVLFVNVGVYGGSRCLTIHPLSSYYMLF
ncbi:hypothetical protein OESDEN_03727 [Oesophagostomum dentatum]|uniref:FAD-binding PCMH-type domain-containing protein n=1 Tax=Oesophagostomum dentatum TaxID=61180 RepID=A0A0B1TGD0_OESDE|nr:hypothetical protein OESDEN_03727 [Oesophagostomum dentatum]